MAVRIGVVGAGGAGCIHLDVLSRMENVELVAVCDTDRPRANAAAERWGGKAHINFRTMIQREEMDGLYICVPPYAHSDAEILAAAKGIHLFIEPPVALTIERAAQLAEAVREAGVITSVGYQWRYLSGVAEARAFLKGKPLGLVVGQWLDTLPRTEWWRHREMSGGQVLEELLHLIDLGRYLCGEVESVSASGRQGIMAARVEGHTVNDADVLAIRFHSGVPAAYACTNLLPASGDISLRLFTDRAMVRIGEEGVEFGEEGRRTFLAHSNSPWQAESRAFVEAIESGSAGKGAIRSSYQDGVASLVVALGAMRSMETRKVVVI